MAFAQQRSFVREIHLISKCMNPLRCLVASCHHVSHQQNISVRKVVEYVHTSIDELVAVETNKV